LQEGVSCMITGGFYLIARGMWQRVEKPVGSGSAGFFVE